MTFVGKVLIVVQVVMSLCFMAFAGAVYVTHENWKGKYEDSEQRIAQLNKAKSDIEANLSQARDEKARIEKDSQEEINKERLRAQTEEAQVRNLTTRLNNTTKDLEQQRALAEAKGIEAANREQEAEVLRKQVADLQKRNDTVSAELNVERDAVFNTQVALEQLQTRFDKLQAVKVFLEKAVSKYGIPTDPAIVAGMQAPAPTLEGLVVTIEKGRTGRTKYAVLSVGEDDGLRVGHMLDVYGVRDQKPAYLGQIKVISVDPDHAVCEVVAPSKNGDIEVGDNVTTRL